MFYPFTGNVKYYDAAAGCERDVSRTIGANSVEEAWSSTIAVAKHLGGIHNVIYVWLTTSVWEREGGVFALKEEPVARVQVIDDLDMILTATDGMTVKFMQRVCGYREGERVRETEVFEQDEFVVLDLGRCIELDDLAVFTRFATLERMCGHRGRAAFLFRK